MKNTITVSEDTTLGVEHSGMHIIVDAAATITLPHEDTYKNIAGDKNEIISGVDGNVNIVGENGVTITPMASALLTKKGSYVKTEYQGNNSYFMWGSLCIALAAGITALLYNNNTVSDEVIMLINWIR